MMTSAGWEGIFTTIRNLFIFLRSTSGVDIEKFSVLIFLLKILICIDIYRYFFKFEKSKFWANNLKFVLQNSPDVHIFSKIFKMFLKLSFYNFSRLFQNFLKIISCFSDNFSQIFPKIDTEMLRNFLLECLKICIKYSPLVFKMFRYVSIV